MLVPPKFHLKNIVLPFSYIDNANMSSEADFLNVLILKANLDIFLSGVLFERVQIFCKLFRRNLIVIVLIGLAEHYVFNIFFTIFSTIILILLMSTLKQT